MACASGCSEDCSAEATSLSISSCVRTLPSAMTSTTCGLPSVSVPVLSKMMACSLAACSSAVAFLNKMPCCAPRPVPTMTAVGIAKPSASGQAMTTTVIAKVSAQTVLSIPDGMIKPPKKYQPKNVASPNTTAAATSHWAARSANLCEGALEFCAICTSLTICARAVSAPTFVARNLNVPVLLIVAPITVEPT